MTQDLAGLAPPSYLSTQGEQTLFPNRVSAPNVLVSTAIIFEKETPTHEVNTFNILIIFISSIFHTVYFVSP